MQIKCFWIFGGHDQPGLILLALVALNKQIEKTVIIKVANEPGRIIYRVNIKLVVIIEAFDAKLKIFEFRKIL